MLASVRQDFGPGDEDRTFLVLSLQELTPSWFEIDAAAFLSTKGDLNARVEIEHDQRITRRLILQPRLELDASAGDLPEREIGSGLSSVEAASDCDPKFERSSPPASCRVEPHVR